MGPRTKILINKIEMVQRRAACFCHNDYKNNRHLNSKSFNAIHTSKDCYKYCFLPRKIKYWNLLPNKIATII